MIAEEVRSILDGHIILSRKLASSNHYPAIDVLASVSRVMRQITTDNQRADAGRLRNLLTKYNEIELLVRIGEYQQGEDNEADEAIRNRRQILNFLQQSTDEHTSFEHACYQLTQAIS